MDFRSMLQKKRYAKKLAKDAAPDWGDLKIIDKEPETFLKKVEKVSLTQNFHDHHPNTPALYIHFVPL